MVVPKSGGKRDDFLVRYIERLWFKKQFEPGKKFRCLNIYLQGSFIKVHRLSDKGE
jgi:hypothetical protein